MKAKESPLRIPRITIRHLMIVVAIVALAIGIEAWRRRRQETYRGLARMHSGQLIRYADLRLKCESDSRIHRTKAARA